MACNNCRCTTCSRFVKTTSVSVSNDVLILVIPDNNYVNHQMVCVGVSQDIPTISTPIRVAIGLGSESNLVSIITENGNYLYSDQLSLCRPLRLQVATDTKLFVKRGCFNRTKAVFSEPLTV